MAGSAWSADVGPVTLAIPEGFDGPGARNLDGGETAAWVKRRPASVDGTLLQVSTIDLGAALDAVQPADRFEAARHYLLEFVKGVGRGGEDLQIDEVEQVKLAGLPAARVRFTGKLEHQPAIGVMYCVLVHHSVVSLRTQDEGSQITPAMYSAISAIDALRVH
jgi:hypothetical protein